jgi:biotin synthase
MCCGGILGMGESRTDRASMLVTLASLEPESVPLNRLIRIPGTPLADAPDLDPFEMVRTIAAARVLMPRAKIRLSAGREDMSDELQVEVSTTKKNSAF